jgi:septum formation protein
MKPRPERVILASASTIRLELLQRAGVVVTAETAGIDEAPLKAALRRQSATTGAAAMTLAAAKAEAVSARHPDALVIGADQILELDGDWFDKPADRQDAVRQLRQLAGRTHSLISGVAVCGGGAGGWQAADTGRLTMRAFDEAFIESYLDRAGPGVLGCVGVFQLEGVGAQLFEAIEGDYFTILGLPLLPLLAHLRERGVVPA